MATETTEDVSLLGKQVQNAATNLHQLQLQETTLLQQLRDTQTALTKIRKEYSTALYALNLALGIKSAAAQTAKQPTKSTIKQPK